MSDCAHPRLEAGIAELLDFASPLISGRLPGMHGYQIDARNKVLARLFV